MNRDPTQPCEQLKYPKEVEGVKRSDEVRWTKLVNHRGGREGKGGCSHQLASRSQATLQATLDEEVINRTLSE